MKEGLVPFVGDPGMQIFGLSAFALALLTVVFALELTESRREMRHVMSSFRNVIVWVSGIAILTIFVRQYIPGFVKSHEHWNLVAGLPELAGMASERDFYHDCFCDLLTVLSVVGTVFGLIIPIGSYLLQRNSLKDEADNFRSELNSKNKEVTQKQDSLDQQMESLKLEVGRLKEMSAGLESERVDDAKNELESMRSNMACLATIYDSRCIPEDKKAKLIENYLLQFVCYLRRVAVIPNAGAIDADISRFCDTVNLFREDHMRYSVAVEAFRNAMKGDDCSFLGAVQSSYGRRAYILLRTEMRKLLPRAV